MTDEVKPSSRRSVVIGAAVLAAAPFVLPTAASAGVVTQKNARYQPVPKGAAKCALCKYYLPGAKPDAIGACKQVAGPISPNGWCQFYAKKAGV